jgi:hypothetical protein
MFKDLCPIPIVCVNKLKIVISGFSVHLKKDEAFALKSNRPFSKAIRQRFVVAKIFVTEAISNSVFSFISPFAERYASYNVLSLCPIFTAIFFAVSFLMISFKVYSRFFSLLHLPFLMLFLIITDSKQKQNQKNDIKG